MTIKKQCLAKRKVLFFDSPKCCKRAMQNRERKLMKIAMPEYRPTTRILTCGWTLSLCQFHFIVPLYGERRLFVNLLLQPDDLKWTGQIAVLRIDFILTREQLAPQFGY
jgi:hypothetical protein